MSSAVVIRKPVNGLGLFSVRDFGAVGNGSTDDQPAIQAAIDRCGAAGGGTVWIPKGDYLLTALGSNHGDGQEAHLSVPYSNVTIAGTGRGSILRAVADAYGIIHAGVDPMAFYQDATTYTMAGTVAYGAMSLTLATHAQAGNFAAGDFIYIRTGNTLPAGNNARNPVAEVNQVVTANAGSGVITLAWPTAQSYAQEYFLSGTDGFTSTAVTANLAIFGVANVTARTRTDINVRDLRFEHTGTGGFSVGMFGGQVVRSSAENCTGTFRTGFEAMSAHRFRTVRGCTFHHTGVAPTYIYTLTADVGTSDVLWQGNMLSGEHSVQMHAHEGASRVRIIGNEVICPDGAAPDNFLSIRARARDVTVLGNTFVGATDGVVFVDDTCTGGGVISGNRLLGTSGIGINVSAPNWAVTGNHLPNGAKTILLNRHVGSDTDIRYLSTWVTPAQPTPVLGILPEASFVLSVSLHVLEAFNSSGTDLLSVGVDDFAYTHDQIADATDVSTTGIKAPTRVAWGTYYNYNRLPTVKAYYVAGGGAATTGKALVTVGYINVPSAP